MAFVPALNTVQVTLVFATNGVTTTNNYYVRKSTGWGEAEMLTLATQFISWWSGQMRQWIGNAVQLVRVQVRDLTVVDGLVVEQTAGLPLSGTDAAAAAPNSAACVTSLRTGLAGRSRRGRIYIGGLTEASTTATTVNIVTAVGIQNAHAQLQSTINFLGYDWVVVSRYLNGVARITALISNIITLITNSGIDTQRRRLT